MLAEIAMKDLKERMIRGGLVRVCAQGANFVLRVGSLMVLARLLEPRDFGLVGMATAVTGVLNLFRDFGLSTASVQRETVTDEQMSTLFWINSSIGAILALLSLAISPLLAAFYHEARLGWVTAVLAAGFILNAAGVQHTALLQRKMRFVALSVIEIVSLVVSIAVGVGMAVGGYGYWALVGMTLTAPAVGTAGAWLSAAWVPGVPHRHVGISSMIRFGGTITLNGLVVYVAYNLEKVLLGRYWGADAIGIYGRAYELSNIPTSNLNSAAGGVVFAALSRVQHDPSRFKSYFLKGYSLVLALTLPITIFCALFSSDLISVLLGAKWNEAVVIFRLLAPTILVFSLINPLSWLLFSIGMVERSLKVGLVLALLVIVGYIVGLPYGPKGVALAYSTVMALWVIPHIMWCVHGTVISFTDICRSLSRPLLSVIVAGGLAFGVQIVFGHVLPPLPRLIVGGAVLLGAYLWMLLYVMGMGGFYGGLLSGLRAGSSDGEKVLVSA
jgi:O-antigen/teichoic acid export membrane protein